MPTAQVAAATDGAVVASPYVPGAYFGTRSETLTAANGHIYGSPGYTGTGVTVLNPDDTDARDIPLSSSSAGVFGMAVSPDESRLYAVVGGGEGIAVIDTVSQSLLTRIPVAAEAGPLAYVGGYLFYLSGTSTETDVERVDPNDPGSATVVAAVPRTAGTSFFLAGAGGVLVVGVTSVDGSRLDSYSVAADGTTAHQASYGSNDGLEGLAVSRDGSEAFAAMQASSTQTVHQLALPALTDIRTYSVPFAAIGLAVSPDGSRLAVGTSTVDVYDTSTGALLWRRFPTSGLTSSGGWTRPSAATMQDTVVFTSDESQVQALLVDDDSGFGRWFRSTLTPTTTWLTLPAIPTVGYGKRTTATATARGVPAGTAVAFTRTAKGGSSTIRSVATDASSVARATFTPVYSGTIHVMYAGDASHLPAVANRAYSAASKTTLVLTGYTSIRHGVRYYRASSRVLTHITVDPKANRRVVVTEWRRISGHWHKVRAWTLHTNSSGVVTLQPKPATHRLLRLTVRFNGDSLNRGSTASSAPFVAL